MFLDIPSDFGKGRIKSKKWLWIAILILVVLTLLAIILIPMYNKHLMKTRSADAKAAVDAVKARVDDWWKTNGTMGGFSIDNAIAETKLSKKMKGNWSLHVAWKPTDIYTREMVDKLKSIQSTDYVYIAPYKLIMAVATAANPLPEGTKVWYEGDTNTYHGYGIDKRVEPDWRMVFQNP